MTKHQKELLQQFADEYEGRKTNTSSSSSTESKESKTDDFNENEKKHKMNEKRAEDKPGES